MESITMGRILRTALIVCVVGVATESRADSTLIGSLHYWQGDGNTEYKEGDNIGGKLAEYSMNGIEKAIGVACELLDGLGGMSGRAGRIQVFAKSKDKDKGHNKYNDGTPEAQNFAVMVVMLAKIIDALLYADENNQVQECCNGLLVREEGVVPWWQISGGNTWHDPVADCRLYIEGFKLDEYLKDIRGTIRRMSGCHSRVNSILYADGPEIDTGPKSSNFAAACQVMARLPFVAGMSGALDGIDRRIAQNEGKQDAESQDLRRQMAAVKISLIAVTEIMYGLNAKNVESKLLRRMVQGAISEGAITAKESPADIVEKIAKIMEQHSHPAHRVLRSMSAQ
jgi:hypothetical protein